MRTQQPADLSRFKHHHTVTVRNYEIDWQGIVHNGNYLLYFEIARLEYFTAVGVPVDQRSITGPVRIVIVRNELDHLAAATFNDRLRISTRVTNIGTSSIRCEAVMVNEMSGVTVAKNVAVLVWTDPADNTSTPVPNSVRELVRTFEGPDANILPNV